MQREILFRGKRVDNNEWVYGCFGYNTEYKASIIVYFKDNYRCTHVVHKETIGQFTGLTDKNGVKVFEGDVIDIHQTVNGVNTFVLLTCVGGYDVRYFYNNKPQREYEYSIYELLEINKEEKEIEIIGNIHDA